MRILIADDHALFRDCLSLWLKQLDSDVNIVMSSSYRQLDIFLQGQTLPDLILLDLAMPDMQGTVSVQQIVSKAGPVPVVVMSADEREEIIKACFDMGIAGYIPKSTDGGSMIESLRKILDGQRCFPPVYASATLVFNDKQKEIMALLAEGYSNKMIAEKMFLSEGTIKQYVSDLLKRLNVDNRVQAAIKARDYLGIGGNGC